jgi:hypothetical protein
MWNIFEKRQEIITIPFCLCFRCGNGYQWVHQYPSVDHVSSITKFTIHLLLSSLQTLHSFFFHFYSCFLMLDCARRAWCYFFASQQCQRPSLCTDSSLCAARLYIPSMYPLCTGQQCQRMCQRPSLPTHCQRLCTGQLCTTYFYVPISMTLAWNLGEMSKWIPWRRIPRSQIVVKKKAYKLEVVWL